MRPRIIPAVPKTAAKRACYLCGHGPRQRKTSTHPNGREILVDTGVHIEFEGWIMVCETCIVTLGDLAGMLSTDQTEKLRAQNAALTEANARLVEVAARHTRLCQALEVSGLTIPGATVEPNPPHPETIEHPAVVDLDRDRADIVAETGTEFEAAIV